MRRILLIAAALAAFAGTSGVAEPQSTWTDVQNARARLIGGRHPDAKQGEFLVGVEIVLPKGWKTYWRSPGETGIPPEFDWSASRNVASAEVLYPAPRRLADAGGVVLGYSDHVIFPVAVKAADASQEVGLTLVARYGICKDICVPVEETLTMPLAPAMEASPPAPLAEALDRVPRAASNVRPPDPVLIESRFEPRGADRRLVFRARFPGGGAGAEAFLEGPGGAYLPLPERVREAGEEVTFAANIGGTDFLTLVGKTAVVTLVGAKGQSFAAIKLE